MLRVVMGAAQVRIRGACSAVDRSDLSRSVETDVSLFRVVFGPQSFVSGHRGHLLANEQRCSLCKAQVRFLHRLQENPHTNLSLLGPSMGTIVSLGIGGLFCTFTFNEAIPFIFRFGWAYFLYLLGNFHWLTSHWLDWFSPSGGLGIIWSVLWLIFSSDTPVKNTHISENEKEYIRTCKAEEKIQETDTVRRSIFSFSWHAVFDARCRKSHGDKYSDHKVSGVHSSRCSSVISVSTVSEELWILRALLTICFQ